jgi:sugar lactone lactonase YvrE
LGEGPIYRESDGTLFFVDIDGKALHSLRVSDGEHCHSDYDRPVCAVALTQEDLLTVIFDDEVTVMAPQTSEQLWKGGLDPSLRFNDAQVDPAGNLLVGTTHRDFAPGNAGLYHLVDGHLKPLREGLGLSNGLGWSANGRELYHIDSLAQEILVAAYDPTEAEITREVRRLDVSGYSGVPDGMTVDSEGCLWIAFFDGGEVVRITPEGKVLARVSVDTPRPTSVCLGGRGFKTMFITTAHHPQGPAHEGGGLYSVSGMIAGRPAHRLAWRARGSS